MDEFGRPGMDARKGEGGGSGTPADSESRTWATVAHLSYFVATIIGPLVVMLIRKETDPFTTAHAKEAINFQLTMFIAAVVSGVLALVWIGFLLIPIVVITTLVLTIKAAMAANAGRTYRYPFTIRFLS